MSSLWQRSKSWAYRHRGKLALAAAATAAAAGKKIEQQTVCAHVCVCVSVCERRRAQTNGASHTTQRLCSGPVCVCVCTPHIQGRAQTDGASHTTQRLCSGPVYVCVCVCVQDAPYPGPSSNRRRKPYYTEAVPRALSV